VALLDLVDTLTARVAELKAEAGRHSGNCSKSPSGALAQRQAHKARRHEWTKGKPKRPKGKQPGAPGAHLDQVNDPDVVVLHPPMVCTGCGPSLADAEVVATETAKSSTSPPRRSWSPPMSSRAGLWGVTGPTHGGEHTP
jgi:hypothetical protein